MPTVREQLIVEEAINNSGSGSPGSQSMRVTPVLFIGDLDVTHRVSEGEWGQAEIPISLDFSVAGRLPGSHENDEIRFYVAVEGILVPQMVGQVNRFDLEADRFTTALLSASSGALLPRTRLGKSVEFFGDEPETILLNAITRVPYEGAQVQITPLGMPLLSFYDDEGFKGEESAQDIVSRVEEQTSYLLRDTVYNGFSATPDTGLLDLANLPVVYEASRIVDWAPSRVEDYYSDVVVFRENDQGEGYAFDPVIAPVEYKGLGRPPFANLSLWIPLNDETSDALDNAAQLAFKEATILGLSTHEGEATLPIFNPLVERGDTFGVHEDYRDDDGTWDILWGCKIRDYKHSFGTDSGSSGTSSTTDMTSTFQSGTYGISIETVVNYDSTLLEADLLQVPALIVPGRSTGIISMLFTARISSGLMARTVPSHAVSLEPSGRYFTPEVSEGQIVLDETGLWVEVN